MTGKPMPVWKMTLREVVYRKTTFLLGVAGVALATASLVIALLLLRQHDTETKRILRRKEAETQSKMAALQADVKKAMHRLGYNAVIIPKDQSLTDWYAEDYAAQCMPQDRADMLKETPGLAERYLPRLRRKLKWTERKWTVIVVGVGKEEVLTAAMAEPTLLVDPIPADAVVVGYELHHALGLTPGDALELQGRRFRIVRCAGEKGTGDDITIWMNLAEAQRLLNKPGLINEILIVEHQAVWGRVGTLRERISKVLPSCQVVEIASETLTRTHARAKTAEAAKTAVRRERQNRTKLRAEIGRTAFLLVPIALFLCGIWISVLAYINVSERTAEIGALTAIGFRPHQIRRLFLTKYLAMGAVGGVLGASAGWLTCYLSSAEASAWGGWAAATSRIRTVLVAVPIGIVFCLVAAWLPAQRAARMDPADVLRHE